jgi:chemotaxis regulatin CheY-phosphate phosphatase CheZ
MKDVVPLLENINSSIAESTTKMPQASNHIYNVTSANELATTEILDLVDQISERINQSNNIINDLFKKEETKLAKLEALKKSIAGNPEAVKLLDEILLEPDTQDSIKKVQDHLNLVNDDSYKITLSLQVQDITAQQLAAVNHLIESVHNALTSIIMNIEQADLADEISQLKIVHTDTGTFDANASYYDGASKQQVADELLNQRSAKTSQEEIDKLFK